MTVCDMQLYVPKVPGMPDYDEQLVPERYGFIEEVSYVAACTLSSCTVTHCNSIAIWTAVLYTLCLRSNNSQLL